MRKQGGPPRKRNQALASLLNMPSVGPPHRPVVVRRGNRGRPIVPEGFRLAAWLRNGGNERQQDRAVLRPCPSMAALLLLAQLAELEVGPELAEAAIPWIAEQGRPQGRAGLGRPARQAQPL